MHFHLPKPLHGWRAFAGEVGIIVVGVLIALAAEQMVGWIHERDDMREIRNSLLARWSLHWKFPRRRSASNAKMV
jgi:hypothetical protein